MTGTHSNPAWQAGFNSYKEDRDAYKNPYPKGTDDYNMFERGWTQALKRSPDVTPRPRRPYQSKKSSENKINEQKLEIAKKQYLKTKGE